MPDLFKTIFKPTKAKLAVDFLFIALFLILVLSLPQLGLAQAFSFLNLQMQIISIAISLILGLVIYYPLSCGLVGIYNFFKKKKAAEYLVLAVVLILLFNPVTYSIVLMQFYNPSSPIVSQICGYKIVGFAANSKAQEAGLKIDDIILKANGRTINTANDLLQEIAGAKSAAKIKLETNRGEFEVGIIQNDQGQPLIGVNVNAVDCQFSK